MRWKLLACFAWAAGSAIVLLAAQQQFPTPPTPQHPIFRAGATLVAVDVYPMRDGRVIEGLTPSDFQVTEDGKLQSVEFFEFLKFEPNPPDRERRDPQTAEEGERLVADPHHRAFVAYFDIYHFTVWGAWRMQQPAIDFLDRTVGPTDYFAAFGPDTPPARLTFGQRTETIAHEIEQYWPQAATLDTPATIDVPILMTPHEEWLYTCYAYRFERDTKKALALVKELITRWRMDLVLTSLRGLTAKLATLREERTNVLLFSDGWALTGPEPSLLEALWHVLPQPGVQNGRLTPNAVFAANGVPDPGACDAELSRLAYLDLRDDFRKMSENARRHNVAFYPIEPAGLEVFGDQLVAARRPPAWAASDATLEPLRALAVTTNGQAIVRTNDIATLMSQLTDTLSSYYLLGYYTTNTKLDDKYRTIEVKVKTPGVRVSARHGYTASPNPVLSTTVTSEPSAPSPEVAALTALSSLDASQSLLASATTGATDVAVVVEVPSAQAALVAPGADVHVTVAGTEGAIPPIRMTGRIDAGARSALVRVPVGTTSGPWHVKIEVGAPADGLNTSLQVARPALALVGSPILYRATPSPRSPLWPSAGHLFSRTDRLHLEWPVTATGPLESRVGRLLDRRGQPLAVGVTLAEPPNADRPTLVGDVSLAPLAPGDYLIELVVGGAGTTERHLVAIRVDR
jgi:VWFA-related protein